MIGLKGNCDDAQKFFVADRAVAIIDTNNCYL